ncbi:hypothetical protein D3C78_1353150 [compost metagenome]
MAAISRRSSGTWKACRVGGCSGCTERTLLRSWAGFFWTNSLETVQIDWGQRKVCSRRKTCAGPNQAAKSVISERSAPAKRLMLCQSSPTANR